MGFSAITSEILSPTLNAGFPDPLHGVLELLLAFQFFFILFF